MNGLDLFSGIGGISLALQPWVRTVAYCESDRYAQAVLLSRMSTRELEVAPIWDDIRTISGEMLPAIDIIFGGFPCQDISVAGLGRGLEGERSGLFFEIMRLAEEIKPSFIFLENVPAIRTRGLNTVVRALADRGYDSRWCAISAQEVGANHKRNRWFLLAHSNSVRQSPEQDSKRLTPGWISNRGKDVADTESIRSWSRTRENSRPRRQDNIMREGWWSVEPNVGRVANGIPFRVDRIRCLGNAVVPIQAREAFKKLIGG